MLIRERNIHLLFRWRQLAIEHVNVDEVRLFGQFPRFLQVVHQSDVCAPRHVLGRLTVRRVVHQLVERLFHIVVPELLKLLRVVSDVPRDVGRLVEADRAMNFHEFHSTIRVEPEQLPEHYVVLLPKDRSD